MIGLIILLILLIIICMYGYIVINILKQKFVSGSIQRKPTLRKEKETHDTCKAAAVNTSRLGVYGLEDRENDWLARQLKEESKLKQKMLSDMNRQ